jgi:site-specific DNA recombinase
MTAAALDAPAVNHGGRIAVSYERISKFRAQNVNTEIVRGVSRQAEDADDIAEARELGPVLHLNGDEGISASRFETRERGDWLALLDMVRAGRVSVVLVWLVDRIIRQTRDLDDLLDACRATGTTILQTSSGTTINPSDPDSVAMAKISGVLAETEVAKMSLRQKRKQAALAQSGQFGGGRRRFGYEPAMHSIRKAEAVYVVELADRILAGEALNAITNDWNARGITTVSGKPWRAVNLRAMILGAHHAGLRTHSGAITGEAAWEGTLPVDVWEAVRAVLTDPARSVGVSTTRKYLLTGVGECGVCGGVIRGRMAGTGKNRKAAYICESTAHVHRSVEMVDPIINAVVGDWLAAYSVDITPDDGAARQALTDEAERRRQRRKELAREYAMDEIDKPTRDDGIAAIDARLREITAAIGDMARAPAVLDGLAGEPNARELFAALPLERRRAVLAAMPATVVLNRAAHRGAAFDPATVQVRPD